MAKILLVEDEASIRAFTKVNLKKEGFEILEAGTGEEGIEIALREKPDVAVLDIMLPGISGYEVCETLRSEMPQMGIIMLTAKTQEVDRILGLEKGCDDYMLKPFNPKELTLRIKSLMRRLNIQEDIPETGQVIKDGPFKLDLYSRKFFKKDEEIDLTPTELSIIKIFISNPGKAFKREEIMDLAWGEDVPKDTKIVDVNIRRIRAKIEENPGKPQYLETVWGLGYRWKKS